MTQSARLDNPESCFVCSRRADGLAVGKPDKLAWFCETCDADLAKIALKAKPQDFDAFELRACQAVASLCGGEVRLEPVDLPQFIQWAVDEFSKAVRLEVESGKPPF